MSFPIQVNGQEPSSTGIILPPMTDPLLQNVLSQTSHHDSGAGALDLDALVSRGIADHERSANVTESDKARILSKDLGPRMAVVIELMQLYKVHWFARFGKLLELDKLPRALKSFKAGIQQFR